MPLPGLKSLAVCAASLLLVACSGPGEDPRITFCRGLAADLAGGEADSWLHADNRIVEPEYAVVKLQSGSDTASCWYAYDAVEPGAMEHANPLLAFATLPYQVDAAGKRWQGPELTEAVKRQQREFGRAVLEGAQQGLQDAVNQARDVVEQVRQP